MIITDGLALDQYIFVAVKTRALCPSGCLHCGEEIPNKSPNPCSRRWDCLSWKLGEIHQLKVKCFCFTVIWWSDRQRNKGLVKAFFVVTTAQGWSVTVDVRHCGENKISKLDFWTHPSHLSTWVAAPLNSFKCLCLCVCYSVFLSFIPLLVSNVSILCSSILSCPPLPILSFLSSSQPALIFFAFFLRPSLSPPVS